jgi:phosphotriesterase-related protein
MAKSQVEAVLGAIDAKDLGITLPHEHVVMDVSYYTTPPTTDEERERYNAPITMQNLNWLRHNLYKSKVNVSIYNEQEAVITDLKIFKQTGGATVVENTVIGINRDIAKMVNISKSSGVHIVCGTGYFVDETIPREVKSASVEKITEVR